MRKIKFQLLFYLTHPKNDFFILKIQNMMSSVNLTMDHASALEALNYKSNLNRKMASTPVIQ